MNDNIEAMFEKIIKLADNDEVMESHDAQCVILLMGISTQLTAIAQQINDMTGLLRSLASPEHVGRWPSRDVDGLG